MRKDEMTVTEALAYIADLQAHPEVQLVNHRKLLKAAAVLAGNVDMPRCKTCKHWDRPESDYGEVPGTGKCKAVVQFWDATQWTTDEYETRKLKPEYAGKLAFVQDCSDAHCELKTLPDFGCVQHEKA